MNHNYRLVWNDAAQRYVPAPETARSRGKSRAAKTLAPALLWLGALLASTTGAQNLPKNGLVIDGDAHITRSANQVTVTQTSQKAIVQWQSFDIGSGNTVRFKQPNANAIALNRVAAGNASRIDGQLRANGQVWLINPNGVVFGQGSQVNVGGLVASTMNTTDVDFNDSKAIFTRGAAQGGITNQGNITLTNGGTLALLARTVKNEGTIRVRLGNVVLAGGDRVTLNSGVDGMLQVEVDPTTVRTLIENKGRIFTEGSNVTMTVADALSASVVSNSGTVQAQTLDKKNGRIMLLADGPHSIVEHKGGLLDARALDDAPGGFVTTRAAKVHIHAGAQVTTGSYAGETGQWFIEQPKSLSINAGGGNSGIGADILTANLGHTNISLTAGCNDIDVNAPIGYDRNQLTLNAGGNISINKTLSVNGTGKLQLNYGGMSDPATKTPAAGSNLHVRGQVDFAQAGPDLLRVNGHDYTVINQLQGLQNIGQQGLPLDGKYALGGPIDASKSDFIPIGSSPRNMFTGTFDGMGHTISDLSINRPHCQGVGLFGRASNATLRNVVLSGGSVKGGEAVGALLGQHEVAFGNASISNVRTNVSVSGKAYVGGLIGLNETSTRGTSSIVHAQATGPVSGANRIGGLVGHDINAGGTCIFESVTTAGSVLGQGTGIGGLIGSSAIFEGKSSVSNSRTAGSVKGAEFVDGLIGRIEVSPAAEFTKSHVQVTRNVSDGPGERGAAGLATGLTTLMLGSLLSSGAESRALPTGGRVVFGKVTIESTDGKMSIRQESPKAILHWDSFDIGRKAEVQFEQSNASDVALNRVTSSYVSQIDGRLSAKGQIWLSNPNGVVFGRGSQVNVGGLVASAMGSTNKDFKAGFREFVRGAARGGIVNQGHITVAEHGTLALLAPTVNNQGTLRAQLGNVMLGGGDRVTLDVGRKSSLAVKMGPATVRTLIENQGQIVADGGNVTMVASAKEPSASEVSNSGKVQAHTLENTSGRIRLMAYGPHGKVEHSRGLLDASAPTSGNGGLVNTDAEHVHIKAGARVTTAGPEGESGQWVIKQPASMTIRACGDGNSIGADMLKANLAHTKITLQADGGNVYLNADIDYDRNQLTLNAGDDICINNTVSVNGAGTLQLNYGSTWGAAVKALPLEGTNLHVRGRVDFARTGADLLRVNGHGYTVVNQLQDLQNIGQQGSPLDGKYALGGPIDASKSDFTPIGSNQENMFTGTFDGLGHTITGLTINRPQSQGVGLFAYASNATLRNVILHRGSVRGWGVVGGLVGYHEADSGKASISNVQSSVVVAGESEVGGLIGVKSNMNATSHIRGVLATGEVLGIKHVGGLVGYHANEGGTSELVSIETVGHISGQISGTGGLIGFSGTSDTGTSTISRSVTYGDVKAAEHVDTLVGRCETDPGARFKMSDVRASGNVTRSTDADKPDGAQEVITGRENGNIHINEARLPGMPTLSHEAPTIAPGGRVMPGDQPAAQPGVPEDSFSELRGTSSKLLNWIRQR